jgi:hypothetical protein
MINYADLIIDVKTEDARSALYYVSRYVKQAKYFEKYGKDIFEDIERSAPSDNVKILAKKIINAIEGDAQKPLTNFRIDEAVAVLNQVTSFERSLSGDFTPEELEMVKAFSDSIEHPQLGVPSNS